MILVSILKNVADYANIIRNNTVILTTSVNTNQHMQQQKKKFNLPLIMAGCV